MKKTLATILVLGAVGLGADATVTSTSQENPSVTLSANSRYVASFLAFYSGQDAITGITPLTNWASESEGDFGTQTVGFYSYNPIDSVDVTAGWTQTAEDAAMIAVTIAQVEAAAAATGLSPKVLINTGTVIINGTVIIP